MGLVLAMNEERAQMKRNELTPGRNAKEFGCVLKWEVVSFKDVEDLLKKLKDDYEHQRSRCFPSYQKEPQLFIAKDTDTKTETLEKSHFYSKMSFVFAWYLCVPNEHIIEQVIKDAVE
jgi:hypothetical protein